MATIRAYTTIDQSRKLAEILPLESADMRYQMRYDNKNNLKYKPVFVSTIIPLRADIPCWSLASLLDIIPNGQVNKIGDGSNKWEAASWNEADYGLIHSVGGFDNPVDACYKMIIRLHELNLL